jgi:RNA polymerase sigma-70 factor (ECF subfamily)
VRADFVEDTVQETLIIVARKLKWLSEPRLFRAWAFRIASREALRLFRKERRGDWHDSDELLLESLPTTEATVLDVSLHDLLSNDTLSPASRAVMVLHFEEGFTLPEVAAVLEIPVGTAKSRLAYGLTVLRRHLGVKKGRSDG